MLNLSDIRKKAKNNGGVKKKVASKILDRQDVPPVEEKSSPQPVQLMATASIPESPAPTKVVAEPVDAPTQAETARPAPLKPFVNESTKVLEIEEEEKIGKLDPLDALFRIDRESDLESEEAYFEGLVGQAQDVEEDLCQLLTFSLGDEEYAVNIHSVQEIIKLRDITDIPRVPNFVMGIISLRGNIIPVFDLKRRLQLGAVEPTSASRIVVCREGKKSVGLMVERINQVVRMSEQAIEQVSGSLSGVNKDLVDGIGRYQGRMLILLDLPSVMTVDQK